MSHINNARDQLDFDQWLKLAEEDPAAFEEQRKAYLDSYIAETSLEVRDRLSRVQWRIDKERELATNPMDACIKINTMMWDVFAGDRGLSDTLNNIGNTAGKLKSAEVVNFKPTP